MANTFFINSSHKLLSNLTGKIFSSLPTSVRQIVKASLYRNYYLFQVQTNAEQKKFLFILAHQRSGSTLLLHLLNMNPDIIGYGETRLSYKSKIDLDTLVGKVAWETGESRIVERYVMDKIVSSKLSLDKKFFNLDNIYFIFLLREPEKSIQSIFKSGFHPSWNEQDSLKYYLERLSSLEDCAKTFNNKERSLFFTYAQLIEKTESVFKAVQQFLDLHDPLSDQYEVITPTSKRFVGDRSINLKSGRIVKEDKVGDKISPKIIEEGLNAYNQCRAILTQYCTTIDDEGFNSIPVNKLDNS